MNEIFKITLTVLGAAVLIIALVYGLFQVAVFFSTKEGSFDKEGSFVIIPESGQPFNVRKVTFINANTVAYEKTDGTGGRISGNFRVEETISQILEKTQDK